MSALGVVPEELTGLPFVAVASRDGVAVADGGLWSSQRRPSSAMGAPRRPTLIDGQRALGEAPSSSAAGTVTVTVSAVLIGKIVAYLVALALVVGGGLLLGLQLQAPAYAGQVRSHSVTVGETLPQVAQLVDTERPVSDVMDDIRVINGLGTDLLVPGQTLALPVQ